MRQLKIKSPDMNKKKDCYFYIINQNIAFMIESPICSPDGGGVTS